MLFLLSNRGFSLCWFLFSFFCGVCFVVLGGFRLLFERGFLKTKEAFKTEPFVLGFDFLLGLVFKSHFDF
ncbi:hypothetical protein B0X69_02590 [Helicobacter pylori]|uniref:Uncharacterized protein n=1 Tax=Helicobacter pylori TaxID=210 RepID=A0A4Y4X0C7_HELPX|nr:hypothetical protein B0X69_02590 [Helicobacter pylori]